MKLRNFLKEIEMPPKKKPRGGHYFLDNGELRKIHKASKGYIYIDTGTSRRDALPIVDLVPYRSNNGEYRNKIIWALKVI